MTQRNPMFGVSLSPHFASNCLNDVPDHDARDGNGRHEYWRRSARLRTKPTTTAISTVMIRYITNNTPAMDAGIISGRPCREPQQSSENDPRRLPQRLADSIPRPTTAVTGASSYCRSCPSSGRRRSAPLLLPCSRLIHSSVVSVHSTGLIGVSFQLRRDKEVAECPWQRRSLPFMFHCFCMSTGPSVGFLQPPLPASTPWI